MFVYELLKPGREQFLNLTSLDSILHFSAQRFYDSLFEIWIIEVLQR